MFTIDKSFLHEHILVIAVTPFTGTASSMVQNIRSLGLETTDIQGKTGQPFYRIMTFMEEPISYIEMVMIFAEESRHRIGTLSDGGFQNAICVRSKSLKLDIEHLQQQYKLNVPLFPTLEIALHEARAQLCGTNPTSSIVTFRDSAELKLI